VVEGNQTPLTSEFLAGRQSPPCPPHRNTVGIDPDEARKSPHLLEEAWNQDGSPAKELYRAIEILEWVADRALSSGVLAEQVNPYTNEPLSVSPLTWSHATFIIVVHEYINKLSALERCHHVSQAGKREGEAGH